MLQEIITILNWLLAIAMWLVIGRAVLDWLTRGRRTVIHQLLYLFTEPLYRPVRRLLPDVPAIAIPVTLILLFLGLRVLLVVVVSQVG
ncbi:YggT family protein [Thermomicrobium sp. CFH 73360]|uniref:YggT family protein n=1 Tax=Thermomicrobium sp. CFH 73360 TaxID=2951987 RepID=UPI0020767FB3|nr:YggT family protein [Thermomicrobium sp. CFH 73360]MCM8744994.1 YggT family protein [Thermomicrobium sp. CFH 73360]